jgi:hypothetical protein
MLVQHSIVTKKIKNNSHEKQMDSIMFRIEIYLWACKVQCHLDVMMTLGGAKSNSLKSMSSVPLH